uniref:Uncharacterized protein n=1 Tax=viral metagenome TaxID=1070528 RepID=A0A6M3LLG8_9ZZZZ
MKNQENTKPIQIRLTNEYVAKLERLQEKHLGVAAARVCTTFVMQGLDAADKDE